MIIEQFVPTLHEGDAVGNSTRHLHRFLLSQGIESRIVAIHTDENLKDEAILFDSYKLSPTPDSIKILHFAVPSELTEFFLQSEGKKVLIYHNITPSSFFVDYSEHLVRMTTEGRTQLASLSSCFDLSIADSSYNATDLRNLGFKNVYVHPLFIDLNDYTIPYSNPFYNLLKDERKNIVFVGRISPNKKIEDLIRLLFFYIKYISPSVRLIVAGNTRTLPTYFHAIRDLTSRLCLTSDDIVFTGHIPFDELLAVYKLGDVFLSMSEHEGFCLPLIESSLFRVPVIAYSTGAVPETLGSSGILFNEKKIENVASLVEYVLNDNVLKMKLSQLQSERIEKYKNESSPIRILEYLEWVEKGINVSPNPGNNDNRISPESY